MKKALLLEDDSALGKGISLALNSQELQIDLCRTLCEAGINLSLKMRFLNLPKFSPKILQSVRN